MNDKTMKHPKDNIGEHDLWADKNFLNRMQITLTIKKKTDKLDKIKNICSAKNIKD